MIIQSTQPYFSNDTGHTPVLLRRLPKAKALWINLRLMSRDPAYIEGQSVESYTADVLEKCRYIIASSAENIHEKVVEGIADRYGGIGIGHNGGSGRAVYLNGYHIKGVGPTPLLGRKTDKGHSSGGAYLEECVRETIMSEIVDAEFPHGSVGIMAIIDTGESVVWQTDSGPKRERKCLLVRQPFLRPAHFERASYYLSDYAQEGARDTLRVRRMFEVCSNQFGNPELKSYLRKFWCKWAEQLAYGFVHRMSHGANSTSNIALDGKLLDFGGMTSLPSLGCFETMYRQRRVGEELMTISNAVISHARFISRFLDEGFAHERQLARLHRMIEECYISAEIREFLRCGGLSQMEVKILLSSVHFSSIKDSYFKIRRHYQRERASFIEKVPSKTAEFDIRLIWEKTRPEHLVGFSNAVIRALSALFGPQDNRIREERRKISLLRTADRIGLYRQTFKSNIYDSLERDSPLMKSSMEIKKFIETAIVKNRRDSHVEESFSDLVGFGYGASSLAIFRSKKTGSLFAVDESEYALFKNRTQHIAESTENSCLRIELSDFSGEIYID